MRDLPCVLVPGGVTLPPDHGEDAGKIQTIGARFAHGLISLQEAAELGCRACATPGGRLPVPGHGGHLAGGRRGAGHVACRTRPWRRRASRSGGHGPCARRARWCDLESAG